MAEPSADVVALTVLNLLDRLLIKLIEKGVLSETDATDLMSGAIRQVKQGNNPHAAEIEALILRMYGGKPL